MVASYDDGQTGNAYNQLSSFSSRGKKGAKGTYPDLAAPGDRITSSCRTTLAICQGAPVVRRRQLPDDQRHLDGVAVRRRRRRADRRARPATTPARVEDLLEDTAHHFAERRRVRVRPAQRHHDHLVRQGPRPRRRARRAARAHRRCTDPPMPAPVVLAPRCSGTNLVTDPSGDTSAPGGTGAAGPGAGHHRPVVQRHQRPGEGHGDVRGPVRPARARQHHDHALRHLAGRGRHALRRRARTRRAARSWSAPSTRPPTAWSAGTTTAVHRHGRRRAPAAASPGPSRARRSAARSSPWQRRHPGRARRVRPDHRRTRRRRHRPGLHRAGRPRARRRRRARLVGLLARHRHDEGPAPARGRAFAHADGTSGPCPRTARAAGPCPRSASPARS